MIYNIACNKMYCRGELLPICSFHQMNSCPGTISWNFWKPCQWGSSSANEPLGPRIYSKKKNNNHILSGFLNVKHNLILRAIKCAEMCGKHWSELNILHHWLCWKCLDKSHLLNFTPIRIHHNLRKKAFKAVYK